MMYGTLNPDRLCMVLEQIFAERNNGIKTEVRLIDAKKEEKDEQKEKTA